MGNKVTLTITSFILLNLDSSILLLLSICTLTTTKLEKNIIINLFDMNML